MNANTHHTHTHTPLCGSEVYWAAFSAFSAAAAAAGKAVAVTDC